MKRISTKDEKLYIWIEWLLEYADVIIRVRFATQMNFLAFGLFYETNAVIVCSKVKNLISFMPSTFFKCSFFIQKDNYISSWKPCCDKKIVCLIILIDLFVFEKNKEVS